MRPMVCACRRSPAADRARSPPRGARPGSTRFCRERASASADARAPPSTCGADAMLLALGLLACSGLWWLGRNGGRLGPRLTPRLIRRAGAWVALALAAILMLRGQLGPALVLGLG